METYDVVIIGSGPAGYTAAIYAARADLKPILFTGFELGTMGGQLTTTTDVDNFPAFPEGISGPELVNRMSQQAKRFGTKILMEDVLDVDLSNTPFTIQGSRTQCQARTLIIATGANAKRLDIEGANTLWQKGVSACAVCDGAIPIFRNKELYVIGGGDSAVEEALFLTKFASKVFIVHRRDKLRASKIMADKAIEHPKVEILWNSTIVKIDGDDIVTSVTIQDVISKKYTESPAAGVFFAVGHSPNTQFLKGQLDLHDNGYIKVVPGTTQTSIPGVFAAGDVQDFSYRQAITAAGTGCMAALEAERELIN
jgi:thioredoxin reductase (NADPH)